jgi:SAM-dependent methyltransferase
MRLRQIADSLAQKLNETLRYLFVDLLKSKAFLDFHLHEYQSYEDYRKVQIYHNYRKIGRVWAHAGTLDLLATNLREIFGPGRVKGLCHGTRNGFEQNHLNDRHAGFAVIGTDISPSARDFPNSVEWDFHDVNPEWQGQFDFVYSNSLDQSWQPRVALETWLDQVRPGGVVVIEYSEEQSPLAAGEMDPFGVRPVAVPYVLADWFGHDVSVSFQQSFKANIKKPNWLFFIRRNAGTSVAV